MVRRFHRSIYDELDELRASMDYLYQLALEPVDNPALLKGDTQKIVCQCLHSLHAEVAEHEDQVAVTLDTVPGNGNLNISVDLIDEITLKITCDHEEERMGDDDVNCLHERRSFFLNHLIRLPAPVMKSGAGLTFRNGVLDIHFRKVQPVPM